MRVLITGGGVNLGRVLAPALEETGYEPVPIGCRTLEIPTARYERTYATVPRSWRLSQGAT